MGLEGCVFQSNTAIKEGAPMPWTKQLMPKLSASTWAISSGSDDMTFSNNHLKFTYADKQVGHLIAGSSAISKALKTVRVTIKYGIIDTADVLFPHDNPCRPLLYASLNLYPIIITDKDDPNYDEPTYFQHINVPFAQSRRTGINYTKQGIKYAYAIAKVNVPVDTKMLGVQNLYCNVFLYRACYVYDISILGEY